ncbi:Predicted helicase [Anaerobiospirillum thomasii]|uniref:Predicted helicase n=2 Tax=Anaerobiospirillum thomasii TaxID=179995 RepID=A0A2X0VBF6_9GAMM|nr:Predicted helicase [Anaerobiospirillum thomasii]
MKWGKIKGKSGNAGKDKTILKYNDDITISNIPLEAQEYVVNKKSALDWVVERACYSQDKKTGIVNDFNEYAKEQGNLRYPLELFLKVITVSIESLKIIKSLPALEIHTLDQ